MAYHFPGRSVDCVLVGTVGIVGVHAHPLRTFWSAPVTNQFMGRLPRLSWYDIYPWDHRVVNIPWQVLVEGGGIGMPLEGTLYGAKDSSPLYRA